MSYSKEKIRNMLFSELDNIPERYTGYQNSLKQLLTESLAIQENPSIPKTRKHEKILEKIERASQEISTVQVEKEKGLGETK